MGDVTESYKALVSAIEENETELRRHDRTVRSRRYLDDQTILGWCEDFSIAGINALDPVHQGRELIKETLERGHEGCILVLDPRSEEFSRRIEKEGDCVGRVLSEMEATFGVLHDIVYDTEPNLTIGLHRYPLCAMVIGFYEGRGAMHVNLYPEEGGVSGATGRSYEFRTDSIDNELTGKLFDMGLGYFDILRDSSSILSVSDIDSFRKELRKIGKPRYGI